MKRLLVMMSLLMTFAYGHSQLKIVDNTIKVNPTATKTVQVDWPKLDADGNRNPKQALVVVSYSGFPENAIESTLFEFGDVIPNKKELVVTSTGEHLTFLFVPLETTEISIKHPTFGPARVSIPALTNKGIYSLDLLVDQYMDIEIEPLSDFESVKVYLDNNIGKDSPAHFDSVSLGKHTVKFVLPDGRTLTKIIEVTPQNVRFNQVSNPDLDLRKLMPVTIESSDKNVRIYVSDKEVASSAPARIELPAGNYTVKAVSKLSNRVFDVAPLEVKENSRNLSVKLTPRERQKFTVSAKFGNSTVPVMLYAGKEEAYKLSLKKEKGERPLYEFELPVGEKYKFTATYHGNEGSRTVYVTKNMDQSQVIEIKKRSRMQWPWEREYYHMPFGFTIAYTQKQYTLTTEGEDPYKGTMVPWDKEKDGNGLWLHGVKVGVQYQPAFRFGLGLYTGLFWEYYRSHTSQFKTGEDNLTTDFSTYQEHSLTLPAQLFYTLPFSDKIALAFHGGFNFNYLLSRQLSGYVVRENGIKFEDSYDMRSDKDGCFPYYPSTFQAYWEVGAQLRFGPVMLGAQLTRPLSDHKSEVDGVQYKTHTVKNSFSFTILF